MRQLMRKRRKPFQVLVQKQSQYPESNNSNTHPLVNRRVPSPMFVFFFFLYNTIISHHANQQQQDGKYHREYDVLGRMHGLFFIPISLEP